MDNDSLLLAIQLSVIILNILAITATEVVVFVDIDFDSTLLFSAIITTLIFTLTDIFRKVISIILDRSRNGEVREDSGDASSGEVDDIP